MNDNDMANMIKKAQEMINNNQIPDELKSLVSNMQNNTNNSNTNFQRNRNVGNSKQNYNGYNQVNNSKQNSNSRNNYGNSNSHNNDSSNNNSGFPDIDIETMMKLQNIMSKMKSLNNDDDMSKLLMSLKPYLRNEKKEKVDEYIKLIKMGKMTQAFDLFGGDKK